LTISIIAILAIILLFRYLSPILLPFFIAWLVAYIVHPLVVFSQKKLGISSKKEIEKLGVEKFNQECRNSVRANEDAFTRLTSKMGQFFDVEHPYLTYKNDYFVINNNLWGKKVVIATGGKTYTKTGSTGMGYNILKSFGHTITKLYPSLTYLKTDYKYIKDLQGVRADAIAKLNVNDKTILTEKGQIQFTKDSLSGICIFNLSRCVSKYLEKDKKVDVVVDLVPDYDESYISNYLKEFSSYNVSDAISCILNKKIADVITKNLKLSNKAMCDISKAELENISRTLKNMSFNITSTGDFETSQVTSGGALLSEFTNTLESKKISGLYASGEVLDVDGICGGYNLSWAFTSALIVAEGILKDNLK